MLSISKGNSKIGQIHNISLTPIKSCPRCVLCKKDCYAMKSYRQYPNVRAAWDKNLDFAQNHSDLYWTELDEHIEKHKPEYFRFHVAGDCPDYWYMVNAVLLARRHPGTNFLMFTKRYEWAFKVKDDVYIPENFSLVLSAWPKMPIKILKAKVHGLRIAWLSEDERRPSKAYECPGSCKDCKECWSPSKDITFKKH